MKQVFDYQSLVLVLLQMVFAIFIFILGIPAVIFQTFIPEELRKIYNQFQKFRDFFLILFFTLLVLGFTFFYHYLLTTPTNLCDPSFINYIIPSFTIYFLLAIIIAGYKLFISYNVREKIIQIIANRCIKSYRERKFFLQADIEDLDYVGKLLDAGLQKDYFIKKIEAIVLFVINHKEKDGQKTYNGDKLTSIVSALFNSTCHQGDSANEDNFLSTLNVYSLITDEQTESLGLADSRMMKSNLLHIGLIGIDKKWTKVANQSKDLLKNLPDSKREVLSFCQHAFEMGEYSLVKSVMKKSRSKLIAEKKLSRLYNFMAYVSFFYIGNTQMKKYAKEQFNFLVNKLEINIGMFHNAMLYFDKIGDYDISEKIRLMIEDQNFIK